METLIQKKKASCLWIMIMIMIMIIPSLFSPSFAIAQTKLSVVTSLFPLKEFASAVGGEWAKVELLLPPSAEPHTWEPTPSDVLKISRSDLFIYLGPSLEPWVHDLLDGGAPSSTKIYEAGKDLLLLEQTYQKDHVHEYPDHHSHQAQGDHDHDHKDPDHHSHEAQKNHNHKDPDHHSHQAQGDHDHDHKDPDHHSHEAQKNHNHKDPDHHSHHDGHDHSGLDPHLWLDFHYDQLIIDQLAQLFAEKDPARADYYHKNAAAYKQKLAALDAQYTKELADCDQRTIFLAGHSAFAYLARRYHFEQVPLYGLSPDTEPTPKRLAEVIDLAKTQKIKAIFFESFLSDRLAKTLAEEIAAQILVLNPGANLTKAEREQGVSFFSLMEQNLTNLKKGLGCHAK